MSRAVNIDASVEQVRAVSARLNAAISTIEALVPKGTRVVLVRAEDARAVEHAFKGQVLVGSVKRVPVRPRHAG